jgi:hypothetical protein
VQEEVYMIDAHASFRTQDTTVETHSNIELCACVCVRYPSVFIGVGPRTPHKGTKVHSAQVPYVK